jgi:hypothetical protein
MEPRSALSGESVGVGWTNYTWPGGELKGGDSELYFQGQLLLFVLSLMASHWHGIRNPIGQQVVSP